MVIVMKRGADRQDVDTVIQELKQSNMNVIVNEGVECVVLGVLGDTHTLDKEYYTMKAGVERVVPVLEPYKKANRKFHPEDTVVRIGDTQVGGDTFAVIAGPCSVESVSQMECVAAAVKASGAALLRGGAYKPRTSPYAFQGLEKEGLEILRSAREKTGLPIVTELMSPKHVEMFEMLVDVIQIGARNMQNFDLLKEVGRTNKPILLKRGLSSTIEEWLMSAEYIMAMGNENVILCERGVRTFETYTRNTLDLSAIVAVKKLSHLPIVVDPSHATGKAFMVPPLALAAVMAGADGLMIEVHNDPAHALCDGPQSLTPEDFDVLMGKVRTLMPLVGRTLSGHGGQ